MRRILYLVRVFYLFVIFISVLSLQQNAISQTADDQHEFRLRPLSSNLDSWYRVTDMKGAYLGYQHVFLQPVSTPQGNSYVFSKEEEVNLTAFDSWNIRKKIRATLDHTWNLVSYDGEYHYNDYHYTVTYKREVAMLMIANKESKKEIPADAADRGVFDINLAMIMLAQNHALLTSQSINKILLVVPHVVSRKLELRLVDAPFSQAGIEKIQINDDFVLTQSIEGEKEKSDVNIKAVNVDEYGRIVRVSTYSGIKIQLETEFEWLTIRSPLETYYKFVVADRQVGTIRTLVEPVGDGFNYYFDMVTSHIIYELIEKATYSIKATVSGHQVTYYEFTFRFGFHEIRLEYAAADNNLVAYYNGVKVVDYYVSDPKKTHFDPFLGALIEFQKGDLYKTSAMSYYTLPFAMDLANAMLNAKTFMGIPSITVTNYGWKRRIYLNQTIKVLELRSSSPRGALAFFLDKFGRLVELSASAGGIDVRMILAKDESDAKNYEPSTIPVFVPTQVRDPGSSQTSAQEPVKFYHAESEQKLKSLETQLELLKAAQDGDRKVALYNEFQTSARAQLTGLNELAAKDVSYVQYTRRIEELLDECSKILPREQALLLNCRSVFTQFMNAIDAADEKVANEYYQALKELLAGRLEVEAGEIRDELDELSVKADQMLALFKAVLELNKLTVQVSGVVVPMKDAKVVRKAVCIINGEVLREGESAGIGGITVKIAEITRYYVMLEYNGATKKFEVMK